VQSGSDARTVEIPEGQLGKLAAFFPAAIYSPLQEWSFNSASIPSLIDLYFNAPGFPRRDGAHLWFDIGYDFRWRAYGGPTLEASCPGITSTNGYLPSARFFAFPFRMELYGGSKMTEGDTG